MYRHDMPARAPQMASTLAVDAAPAGMSAGAFVRVKRGAYRGDLARVEALLDGGRALLLRIVPRIDPNALAAGGGGKAGGGGGGGLKGANGPQAPQRMFNTAVSASAPPAQLRVPPSSLGAAAVCVHRISCLKQRGPLSLTATSGRPGARARSWCTLRLLTPSPQVRRQAVRVLARGLLRHGFPAEGGAGAGRSTLVPGAVLLHATRKL